MDETMSSFYSYYERAIHAHDKGFKHVAGGTGLGKTSIIPTVVRDALSIDRKAIYITSRVQLLKEMADTVALQPHEIIWLKRNLETVLETLKNHEHEFNELLSDPTFLALTRNGDISIATARKACATLQQWHSRGDKFERGDLQRDIEKQIEKYARQILSLFKHALRKSRNTESGNWMLDHPVIQSLFPFIAFRRRPEVRLLLITLQKAYHGCFDGTRTCNLTHWNEFVVFLDEFDFLENELVKLISKSPQIEDVFKFVEYFYREMTYHKLPLPSYPEGVAEEMQRRIREIVDQIKQLKLRFPQINQFTMAASERPAAIFRTSHIISTGSLWLRETERAYDISQRKPQIPNERTLRAEKLFRAIGSAAERILTLFKELEEKVPVVYHEVKRQCYGGTVFEAQLDEITHFPQSREDQKTQLSSLLLYGWSIYDIHNLSQRTDPEEVQMRHYSMYTTPENILLKLVKNNLVFALSATADIPRCVHHFDLQWLRDQEEVNYIEVNNADKRLIQDLNKLKKQRRGTMLRVLEQPLIDRESDEVKDLAHFVEAVAKDPHFAEGPDSSQKHREKRVLKFFETLGWIIRYPDEVSGLSHLLFVNSFRQIKLILDKYGHGASSLFSASVRKSSKLFSIYDIHIRDHAFIVILYNAEAGRNRATLGNEFDALFHENVPVIVVTQYLSAGNGVNLQYRSVEGVKTDFCNLHLLEAPYFYFGNPNSTLESEEQLATLKQNIWYQAKLFASRMISAERFRYVLSTIHQPGDWNQRYLSDTGTQGDAILNQFATFAQALGRVEREWQPVMSQTIRLSNEVYDVFHAFLGEEYDTIRLDRAHLISSNLSEVLNQVESKIPQKQYKRQDRADVRLKAVNLRCSTAIHRLAAQLTAVRHGTDPANVRNQWEEIRKAVLTHDYHHALLEKYDCVWKTSYLKNGVLWLNREDEVIPTEYARSLADYRWDMNAIYATVQGNTIIREYFSKHGYQLGFTSQSNTLFTPYCYQAILAGAIGEESIVALMYSQGIALEKMPNSVFELADLKLKATATYIDCKLYTDTTMERFQLPSNDPLWHPKLNSEHFQTSAQAKWKQLQDMENEPTRLIYMNLTSHHERPTGYYNASCDVVSNYQDAQIVIVQGCLDGHSPNNTQNAFKQLMLDLHHSSIS